MEGSSLFSNKPKPSTFHIGAAADYSSPTSTTTAWIRRSRHAHSSQFAVPASPKASLRMRSAICCSSWRIFSCDMNLRFRKLIQVSGRHRKEQRSIAPCKARLACIRMANIVQNHAAPEAYPTTPLRHCAPCAALLPSGPCRDPATGPAKRGMTPGPLQRLVLTVSKWAEASFCFLPIGQNSDESGTRPEPA